jgi:predicted phage tail protein
MNLFKKMLIGVLILSILSLYFPKIGLAGDGRLYAKAATTDIKERPPEIISPPEKDIPVEEVVTGKKNRWLWVVLGAVAVGSLLAVAGGGGGGEDGDNTGTIVITGPGP